MSIVQCEGLLTALLSLCWEQLHGSGELAAGMAGIRSAFLWARHFHPHRHAHTSDTHSPLSPSAFQELFDDYAFSLCLLNSKMSFLS